MFGVYALVYNMDNHNQEIWDSGFTFDTRDEAVVWMDYDGECELFAQSVSMDTETMEGNWFVDDIVVLTVEDAKDIEEEFRRGTV